jgi:hypothetical protein
MTRQAEQDVYYFLLLDKGWLVSEKALPTETGEQPSLSTGLTTPPALTPRNPGSLLVYTRLGRKYNRRTQYPGTLLRPE